MPSYEKKGYLTTDFKIFHLKDTVLREFQYHYHEFDKIIIFLSGQVDYMIEGKSYTLHPHDVVFVNRSDIHKPTIDFSQPYERIIIYISPEFIKTYKSGDDDLGCCFKTVQEKQSHVLRLTLGKDQQLLAQITRLSESLADRDFAHDLYTRLLFLEFMVLLNRSLHRSDHEETSASYDKKTLDLLNYINANLLEDLSVDDLAQKFFISKYYMMRKFKAETGYTIHQYITDKRLLYARELIGHNIPLTKICFDCGFKDYSTFSRAFKGMFKCTPRIYKQGLHA